METHNTCSMIYHHRQQHCMTYDLRQRAYDRLIGLPAHRRIGLLDT